MREPRDDIDNLVIQSYLDGELGGSDLDEFERQLSEDSELRAAVEAAELEHGNLRDLLAAPSAPAALKARITMDLDAEDLRGRRSQVRKVMSWSLPGASVLAAAAALVLFISMTPGDQDDGDNVAKAAVRQRMRTKVPTPAVNPPSRGEVSASLTRYFDSPVSPPRFASKEARLDGWQPASLKGYEAAQLQYSVTTRSGRHLVTVHILDARTLELRGQRRVDVSGQTVWVERPFGFSAVSYREGRGMASGFTSEMSEPELIDLVVSSDILHRIGERLR